MIFTPRPYQQKAIDLGVEFLLDKKKKGGAIEILPTGSGKSVVIASIARRLDGKCLVLQPSKEILEQNYKKMLSYGYRAGIFSASVGKKQIHTLTFATIGSIIGHKEKFNDFKFILIDECHLVNANGGMYEELINHLAHCRVLGFTATPYRLSTSQMGAMLRFLTRTRPRIFNHVAYAVQIKELVENGWLAKLKYFNMPSIERNNLKKNSTGADYTDSSLRMVLETKAFTEKLVDVINRLVDANRKGILVFVHSIDQANKIRPRVKGSSQVITGKTPMNIREQMLKDFVDGKIKTMLNVGVLTTGFDYPELDTVVSARPTMSLALYYQIIGRIIRPHPEKSEGWVIDMVDNMKRFGKVEDLKLRFNNGKWHIENQGKQLTNVYFD